MATEKRKVGNYEILETLGKGGYSWVKKGRDEKTNRNVALKFMARAADSWAREQAEQVRTEIKSLTQIRHENVMKLYAYNLNAKYPQKDGNFIQTILLVLEYCPGGELFDILYYTDKLDAKTARTYFQMMIQGLKACHMSGVCHRDIKPQNLLLDRDFQLKLTDFGLSKIHDASKVDQSMSTTYVGTRGYQAPELLSGKKYRNNCDIFSAGVVLFILLTGYPPFDQGDKRDKWYRPLYKGDTAKFWKNHEGCGVEKDCRSLIEKMLCYKAKDRISIEEIEAHPWYNGEVYSKEELKKVLKERHANCITARQQDAAKQKDLIVSVKKRDIPDEMQFLTKATPELGDMPLFNTLTLKDEVNPFAALWRSKELLEHFAKANVTFDPESPFEYYAKIVDAGLNLAEPVKIKGDVALSDEDEIKEEPVTAKAPVVNAHNTYTIHVIVKTDIETGKNFIEFKRGVCEGNNVQITYRRIMAILMPKILNDPTLSPGEAPISAQPTTSITQKIASLCSPAQPISA